MAIGKNTMLGRKTILIKPGGLLPWGLHKPFPILAVKLQLTALLSSFFACNGVGWRALFKALTF